MSKEKKEKVVEPKYEFGSYADLELVPVEPLKKKIAKTMEVTETFTIFEVMQYIAKLKKGIEDKEAEKAGLVSMLAAYEKELALIEKNLGVQALQDKWEAERAEQMEKEQAEQKAVEEGETIFEEIINEDEKNN